MGNVGGGEILVLLLVALIFLGPEKLPEVARQVGKVVGEIRKVTSGFQREMQDAVRMIDDAANEVTSMPTATPAASVPAVDTPVVESSATVVDDPPTDAESTDLAATVAESTDVESTDVESTDAERDGAAAPSAAPPLPFEDTAPVASAAPPLPVDTAHGGDR